MPKIVIVAAHRTPQGKFLGALSKFSAVDLAVCAGKAALSRIGPENIDLTIIGNVLGAGAGMNVGRQIALYLGIPQESPAFSVNMMCASGMKAILLGTEAIRSGEASVVLCGGTESMSNAPYVLPRARTGLKFGDATLNDTILCDGLVDAFTKTHMGLTAERLARDFAITREQQDEFAAMSHQRWKAAQESDCFQNELVPLAELKQDEHPRPDTTVASLTKLKPAFDASGTVTAGNSSGINDGAALLILCSEETARNRNWKPLAQITSHASAGCDPALMGLGPVHAVRKLLEKTRTKLTDFDAIEINEAFAAQTLACLKQLGLGHNQVNSHGGAIALGHPIGTSGARLIVHLAHQISLGKSRRALATLCIGGGMGQAVGLSPMD